MLKLLTLYTFKKIFDGLENELSSYAQMVYINSLIYHFSDLEISEKNAHAFKVYKSEIKVGTRANKGFIELEKSGLISIEDTHIVFHNAWGQFIDRSALINPTKESALNSIDRFKKELLDSELTREYVLMKYKIKPEKYPSLVDRFVEQQSAMNKIYSDLHDVTKHFYYWVGKNKNDLGGKGKSTTILGM